MTKKTKKSEQIDRDGVLSPGRAKQLYNLVAAIPDEVYETNPIKNNSKYPTTKKNVLEGLNAEFFQPFSFDALDFLSTKDASFRGHSRSPGTVVTYKDKLIDYSQQDMLDQVELNTLVFELLKDLAYFKYSWFEVIMFRFGFWDGTVWKLQEIAEQLDLTRERVRQIQERALQELRNILWRKALQQEISELGVVRYRKVSVPTTVPTEAHKKRGRGRPPKIYDIAPLSEMDTRTLAPLTEVAQILSLPEAALRRWTTGSDFPASRKNAELRARVFSVSAILDWAIQHDRVRITH